MTKKLFLIGVGALILAGCSTHGRNPHVGVGVSIGGGAPPIVAEGPGGGPPPWAPANGRRAKAQRYYYYPDSGVYVNVSTGSYFYLNGGTWQMAMTLPSTVRLNTSNYVSLELETDRPYLFYNDHKIKYKGKAKFKGHGRVKKFGLKNKHWKK